jgi:hypothetical protein
MEILDLLKRIAHSTQSSRYAEQVQIDALLDAFWELPEVEQVAVVHALSFLTKLCDAQAHATYLAGRRAADEAQRRRGRDPQ